MKTDLMYTISVLSSLILSLFDVAQDLMSATQDSIDAMTSAWAEGSKHSIVRIIRVHHSIYSMSL